MILAPVLPKEVHGIQCAQIWFEMDDIETIRLIERGDIEHSIEELREMSGYEQMKAGAVGFSDMVEDLEPDEKRTYAVYVKTQLGFHNVLADFEKPEQALAVSQLLAEKYNVGVDNRIGAPLQRSEAQKIAEPFMKDIPL